MQKSLAYRDGIYLPKDEIRVELNDLGFERGFAVFDYCRIRNGKVTFLKDHFERLNLSQSILNFQEPVQTDEVEKILSNLHNQNKSSDGYFKILISAKLENEIIRPVITIYEDALIMYPQELFENGIALILQEFEKPFAEFKTTFYLGSLREYIRMKESNAEDVLFYAHDTIRECARCNIFTVKGNAIYTPDKNILKGVTRKHVIQCARQNYFVIESDISVSDLFEADEVFISSTTKNIMPVIRIEDRMIGNGMVGNTTKELMKLFTEYCMHYVAD